MWHSATNTELHSSCHRLNSFRPATSVTGAERGARRIRRNNNKNSCIHAHYTTDVAYGSASVVTAETLRFVRSYSACSRCRDLLTNKRLVESSRNASPPFLVHLVTGGRVTVLVLTEKCVTLTFMFVRVPFSGALGETVGWGSMSSHICEPQDGSISYTQHHRSSRIHNSCCTSWCSSECRVCCTPIQTNDRCSKTSNRVAACTRPDHVGLGPTVQSSDRPPRRT